MSEEFRSRRRVLQATGVTISSGLGVGIGGANADDHEGDVSTALPTTFSAELTGEAVPDKVETNASGTAAFELSLEDRAVHYTIDVEWLCDPTAVRIRYGTEDEAGHELVQLCPREETAGRIDGRFDGTLAEGTLTTADLSETAERTDLETVASELAGSDVYVSVATESYSTGEIRGRIVAEDGHDTEPIGDASDQDHVEESVDDAPEDDREETIDERSEDDPSEEEPVEESSDDDPEAGAAGEDHGETVYGAPEDPDDDSDE